MSTEIIIDAIRNQRDATAVYLRQRANIAVNGGDIDSAKDLIAAAESVAGLDAEEWAKLVSRVVPPTPKPLQAKVRSCYRDDPESIADSRKRLQSVCGEIVHAKLGLVPEQGKRKEIRPVNIIRAVAVLDAIDTLAEHVLDLFNAEHPEADDLAD